MKANNKWLMFKNFLHNEMDITKEDIRQWVKESCEDVARRMVENEFEKFTLSKLIERELQKPGFYDKRFKDRVYSELATQLVSKINLVTKTS